MVASRGWLNRAVMISIVALATSAPMACSGGGSGPGAIQTRAVRHLETGYALAGDDLRATAADYVRSFNHDLGLGLSPGDDYAVLAVMGPGPDGLRHARLQQTHGGVPVLGSEILVHADATTYLGFNGYVTGGLDGFDTGAAIAAADATGVAQGDATQGAPDSYQFAGQSSRLVIAPDRDRGGATLAWQVEFADMGPNDPGPGAWRYLVDARDGTVLDRENIVESATVEQASGPGGGKVPRAWSNELDVVADGDQFKMDTDRLVTQDSGALSPFFNGDAIKGPLDDMPDPIANDAQGYAEITLNMLRDWMGRNSIDDQGRRIDNVVHFRMPLTFHAWENAAWMPVFKKMFYGDGGDRFYPLSGAIDVVAHEIDHGFTQFHSNLSYKGQSGGLNESFSDVAGTVAEFYDRGEAANFLMGENVWKGDGGLRDMCDPASDGSSINTAADFTKGLNPHYASGVGNRAFCLAVSRYRAGPSGSSMTDAVHQVGRIWYQANGSYWSSGSSYADACQGTIDAAQSLGYSREVVEELRDSWADVGVDCAGPETFACNNNGTCDADQGETCSSCPDDCGACSESCSAWKKFKCKLHIGDCSRCDGPKGCGDGVCNGDENDENCGQDCGCAVAGSCGGVAPFGCYCDAACADHGDCCADVSDFCGPGAN